MDDLSRRAREIIAVELQLPQARLVPHARLRDLGMDSIAALNIAFAVQEAFGIEPIDDAELQGVVTVADIERLVRRHLAKA